MLPINRRQFLRGAAAGLVGTALGSHWSSARSADVAKTPERVRLHSLAKADLDPMRRRFLGWLRGSAFCRERPVRNLAFNFFDTGANRGTWIYPMLSGKAMLWFLRQGRVDEATAVAGSLLRWQQSSLQGKLKRSYGAFPSKIERSAGGWQRGDRYYSGDNLVILEALLALYEKAKDPDLINSAIGVGTWLTAVMCKGHEAGVWAEDHAAPMWFVTASGDFSNEIHNNVEMLWIDSLSRLGRVVNEGAYSRQAERAYEFLRQGQHSNGAYFDHYAPGFPPARYEASHWKPYQPRQVIADNLLRSALGACRHGEFDRARRFFRWLQVDKGALPAYTDLETGGSGFPAGQDIYFDVTSSALHRSLCQWLGERSAAEADMAFIRSVQHPSGGWYWGIRKKDRLPPKLELAPIVGFWATEDLSAPRHS